MCPDPDPGTTMPTTPPMTPPMTPPHWNFGDIFEAVAAAIPDAPAIIDGDRQLSWREFDAGAAALGTELRALGLTDQCRVAVYLRNSAEFLQSYHAAMLARLVPINVNYRYGPEELVYLLADSEAEAVVIHAEFAHNLLAVAPRLPKVRHWLVVGDLTEDLQPLRDSGVVLSYAECVRARSGQRPQVTPRSGADLLIVYTGGTTGMPKGVMWQQGDAFEALVPTSRSGFGIPAMSSIPDLVAGLVQPGPRGLSASPMMHGTGLFHQFVMLLSGGTAVIFGDRRFDAHALWANISRNRVSAVVIVGDAFAGPMLDALREDPGRHDLSALQVISSSGAIWSRSNKLGLLELLPWITAWDALAAGEGFGVATNITVAGETAQSTGEFVLGPNVRVRRADGSFVAPGEAGSGAVMVRGPLPLGYFKDPEKTAAVFVTVDGVRYSIPGDFVEVLANGHIQFLGRGSACINTGGEKVFVEEVEEVVHNHPAVQDAACVGIPDQRFGAVVCAVVKLHPGQLLTLEELADHVKQWLAGYKAPRRMILVDDVPRTAQGKPAYALLKDLAASRLAAV